MTGPGMMRVRSVVLIAALAAALTLPPAVGLAPACAQQMMRLLERGPVGFLHGQTLLQQTGNLTAGDFAHPATFDWDGDGRTDLIVGSGYGDLLLFTRPGGGFYGPPRALLPAGDLPLDAAPERRQVSPWLGDLDGDGGPEMLLGIADCVYRYAVRGGTTADGTVLVGPETAPDLAPPLAPCAADLDGDGAAEIIIADGNGRLFELAGTSPLPIIVAGAPLQVAGPARAWAGDWTGDGRADLLIGAGDGRVLLCAGAAAGLGAPQAITAAAGAAERDAAPWATDFDGDGDLDLLVGGRAGFVALLERSGPDDLALTGYLQQTRAPIDAGRCAVATAGDWDGDGLTDLVVGGEDGRVQLYVRLAGPELLFVRGLEVTGEDGPVVAEGPWPRFAAPALTDWDADGDLDLLVGGASGRVLVWRNTGGLQALGPVQVGGAPLQLAGITMPAPFDYNADGDTDLFVGARPQPEQAPGPGVVLPEIAPGCAYFENIANRTGVLPNFEKGVPIAMTLTSHGDGLRRDAGFLAPYATYPGEWARPWQIDFITVTLEGTYVFENLARRGAYADLQAQTEGRALPPALLPPLYSAVPALLDGTLGLLAADCPYGFVCWYRRDALEG